MFANEDVHILVAHATEMWKAKRRCRKRRILHRSYTYRAGYSWCPAARQSPWCAAARQPPPSVVRSRKAAASLRHCASATRQQRSANTAHVRFSKIAPWEARLAGGGRKPQAKTVRNANFSSKARRKALRAGQQECATAAADESPAVAASNPASMTPSPPLSTRAPPSSRECLPAC